MTDSICCSKILSSSFNISHTFHFPIKQSKALKTDWYGYNKPQKVGPTQYLAVCLQTICCVSLIHRSSQSQRNRWKWSFRQVQQLLCNFMLVWAGYFWLEDCLLIVAFQEALLAMTQSSCCVYQNERTSLLKEIRTTQRTNKSALYAHRIYSKSVMQILSQPVLSVAEMIHKYYSPEPTQWFQTWEIP